MKKTHFNSIIKNIVKQKTPCFFISPHLDDAALSAGGLISYLSEKVPVTVVNVFTKAHGGTQTFSVKSYLKQCGYKDASKLFAQRRKEDKSLYEKIGVAVVNLGFVDAMWRKREIKNASVNLLGKLIPELVHRYPTYRFHSFTGEIAKDDRLLMGQLEERLKKLTKSNKDYVVFCPVGIGHYIDHVIVRIVCSKIFKKELIYWSDFNYSMEFAKETKFIDKNKLNLSFFDKKLTTKKKLIEGYKTQLYAIFPHGKIPVLPDFYYL